MRKTITLLFTLALLSTAAVAKEGYYRWLDDNGQPHFTQNPPGDRPSQFVETRRGYSGDDSTTADQAANTDQAAAAPQPEKPQQYEVLPEKNAERCEQAETALESFSRSGLIRARDPDTGETRIIDNEEREEQKERAREMVDIYC